MIPWTPEPTRPGRPIDRPAVAIIVSAAMALAALLGLYAAHVTAHRDAPADQVNASRTVPGIDPVCRTHTRGHAGVTRRPVPSVPCHVTTWKRGIV